MIESKLALGTAQFGIDYGINNKRGKIPEEEVFEILRCAFKNKINTLDTAPAYGDSEKIIGGFLRENNLNFKIISKRPSDNLRKGNPLFYKSLNNLNRDNLYGYLVHDFKTFVDNPKIWETLKKLKAQEKIKKIGFSLYYPEELKYILEKKIALDIIQVPFSIFDQRFSKTFKLLKERDIEIHVRSIFLQGLVFKNPKNLPVGLIKIKDKLLVLQSLSKKFSIPVSALCINFAILNENIDKIIIGIDNLNNLKENVNDLKYQNKVMKVYDKLLALNEKNEKIILPINWCNQK